MVTSLVAKSFISMALSLAARLRLVLPVVAIGFTAKGDMAMALEEVPIGSPTAKFVAVGGVDRGRGSATGKSMPPLSTEGSLFSTTR